MFDAVIEGGTLLDGSGEEPRARDVGVRDGRVVTLCEPGGLVAAPARERIDATGAWVLPGFVDVHTHYDLCLSWPGLSEHCLRQGITTVVGGNCGMGVASVREVLARASAAELAVSFGVLAPLGPLRSRVVPRAEGRAANEAERSRLALEVADALESGALGVSWGPYHANSLMDAAEIEAALAPAAARGRPFCIHRRSEGKDGLGATQEALSLARGAGVPLQISHLKAAGKTNWGDFAPVLECIEAARREQDVTVDVYPYDASLTYLSALIPDALKSDGGLRGRLETSEGRRAARAGIEGWFSERMGPEAIVLLEPALEGVPRGSTLSEAAERLGEGDAVDAAIRLMLADGACTGGWAIYREMMNPEQVEAVLDLSYAAVASDAVPEDQGDAISAHPRAFATFARALRRCAHDPRALAEAVRRCTRFPAQRFGLSRGLIAENEVADLLVVRQDLAEGATYREPTSYPEGVEFVFVGGAIAFRDGAPTGEGRGEVLRG